MIDPIGYRSVATEFAGDIRKVARQNSVWTEEVIQKKRTEQESRTVEFLRHLSCQPLACGSFVNRFMKTNNISLELSSAKKCTDLI
jgi:hypothetical protein